MNSIVCVGYGDWLYREQWNISGDRQVSIVIRDLNPRSQAVLFYRPIPSVFHKTCQNIHPKTPLKRPCFFYMSRALIRLLSGLQTSKLN